MRRLTHQQFMTCKHTCWVLHFRGFRYRGVSARLLKFRKAKFPNNAPIRSNDHWASLRIHEVERQTYESVRNYPA